MLILVLLSVVLCFGFIVYESKYRQLENNESSIPEILIVSASVSYLIYSLFFYFADYIRSFNIKFPHAEFIPPARAASYEYDGIEGYTLYALMFVNIVVAFFISRLVLRVKNKNMFIGVFLVLAVIAAAFFLKIGFIPAMSNFKGYENKNPFVVIVALLFTGGLWYAYQKLSAKMFLLVLGVVLVPVCFVATTVLSVFDYSFILSPALRIMEGAPLSDIYFQYDFLLSLIAVAWMKLNIDINLLQVLGQLSFYGLFIGAFVFSRKYFLNKTLAVFMVVLLVVLRYYALMHEPVAIFQVTPLRLELWFILLVIIYYKGAYHWTNGLVIGLLLMFHRNFGLIWLLSYYQLIGMLFVLDVANSYMNRVNVPFSFLKILKKQIVLNYKNLLIVIVFVGASILMFKGFIPKSALIYQQIGVGMIQIMPQSFYWYFLVILSMGFILLLKYRSVLSDKYLQAGFFILFVTIGNSIYFFGRSHEHNILNISTSLMFTLFLVLDLLFNGRALVDSIIPKPKTKKGVVQEPKELDRLLKIRSNTVNALPFLLVAGASFYYSDITGHKVNTQIKNLKKGQFVYPLEIPTDFASLKKITNNSDSVYFLNYQDDFLYYYCGHYKPQGYFSPCATWLLKKDLVNFVQGLIDKNYYIVTTDLRYIAELLPNIHYNRIVSEGAYTAISKDSVELLFSENSNSTLAHIGVSGSLGNNAIYLPPVTLNKNFAIEVLLKPGETQVPDVNLVVNALTDSSGSGGFSLQQNGKNVNQYVFGYAGGKSWINPPIFSLQPNSWNYLVVMVNNRNILVYNNGLLVAKEKAEFDIKNVEAPLVVGNGVGRTNQFNGLIREVEIINDTIAGREISKNWENIKSHLK